MMQGNNSTNEINTSYLLTFFDKGTFINKTMTEITFLLHSCKNKIELLNRTCINNDRKNLEWRQVGLKPSS